MTMMPGQRVAEYRSGTYTNTVTFTRVERHTANYIVLENGNRYRKDTLKRQLPGTFAGYVELKPEDDRDVRLAVAADQLDSAVYRVDALRRKWVSHRRTAEELDAMDAAAADLAHTIHKYKLASS
jgi:hypothetical protein